VTGSLEVGEVVRRVFAIYIEQAAILFPAAAVVFVIGGLVANLIVYAAPGLAVVAIGLQLVTSSVYTGMIVKLVADVRAGRRDANTRRLLRAVQPVLPELVIVSVVAFLGELIGLILLVPGLILLTLWAVAAPVVVVEHPGGLRALARSRELVRGNAWQVFGVIVSFGLVVLSGLAVALLASAAGEGANLVAQVVVSVLVLPLVSLASAVLYFELHDLKPAVAP
jgi:hypothetical protein